MSADTMVERDFVPCPLCKQYSHSVGDDDVAKAFQHFQSMVAHPVRGHPMGDAFDEQTRDAAQVLAARIERLEAEKRLCVGALEEIRDHSTERACMTSTEHTERTLSEVQDIARTTLSAVGEIRDQED